MHIATQLQNARCFQLPKAGPGQYWPILARFARLLAIQQNLGKIFPAAPLDQMLDLLVLLQIYRYIFVRDSQIYSCFWCYRHVDITPANFHNQKRK